MLLCISCSITDTTPLNHLCGSIVLFLTFTAVDVDTGNNSPNDGHNGDNKCNGNQSITSMLV